MLLPLTTWIVIAGIGQLSLVLASLAIPRVLKWRDEVNRLRPLTRQVFWTYAGYIWATNLCFGLVSLAMPQSLVEGTPLAAAVCGFIAAYWGARLAIQFVYFDRSDVPSGWQVRLAEYALVALFALLTVIYGWSAVVNLRAIS